MKTKKIELDVDVIGGQDPLSVEEAKAISEFIKQRKNTKNKVVHKRPKTVIRSNVNAE